MKKIKFKALCEEFELPKYATEGSANFDLCAHFKSTLDGKQVPVQVFLSSGGNYSSCSFNNGITLQPGHRALIPLGFSIELPRNKKLEIYSRSGLSLKNRIVIVNAPGQVDSDYRGCVCAIIANDGSQVFTINEGDRICQGAIVDVIKSEFELVSELSETKRSDGGFGHSGIK